MPKTPPFHVTTHATNVSESSLRKFAELETKGPIPEAKLTRSGSFIMMSKSDAGKGQWNVAAVHSARTSAMLRHSDAEPLPSPDLRKHRTERPQASAGFTTSEAGRSSGPYRHPEIGSESTGGHTIEVETFVGSAREGFAHQSTNTFGSGKAEKFGKRLNDFVEKTWKPATGRTRVEDLNHSETRMASSKKMTNEDHLTEGQMQMHAVRGRLDMCDHCFAGFKSFLMEKTESTVVSYTGGETFGTAKRWKEAGVPSVQYGAPGFSVQRPEANMGAKDIEHSVSRAKAVHDFRQETAPKFDENLPLGSKRGRN